MPRSLDRRKVAAARGAGINSDFSPLAKLLNFTDPLDDTAHQAGNKIVGALRDAVGQVFGLLSAITGINLTPLEDLFIGGILGGQTDETTGDTIADPIDLSGYITQFESNAPALILALLSTISNVVGVGDLGTVIPRIVNAFAGIDITSPGAILAAIEAAIEAGASDFVSLVKSFIPGYTGTDQGAAKTDFDNIVAGLLGYVGNPDGLLSGTWTLPTSFPKSFPHNFRQSGAVTNFVTLGQWRQLLDGMVNDGDTGHTPAQAVAAFRERVANAKNEIAQAVQDGLAMANKNTGIAQGLQNIGIGNLGTLLVGGTETDLKTGIDTIMDKTAGKIGAVFDDLGNRFQFIASDGTGLWTDATKLQTTIGGELTNVEDAAQGFVDNINAAVGVAPGQTIDTIQTTFENFPGQNLIHDIGLDGNSAHQQLRDAFCNAFGLPGAGHGIADCQTAAAGIARQIDELINGKKASVTIIAEAGSGNLDPAAVAPFMVDGDLLYRVSLGGGGAGAGGSILLHGVGGNAGAWSSTSVAAMVRGTDWHAGDTFDWVVGGGGHGGAFGGGTGGAGADSTITLHGGAVLDTGIGGVGGIGTSGAPNAWWGDGVSPNTNTIGGTPITGGATQKAAGYEGHSSGGAGAGGDIGTSAGPGKPGASGLVAFVLVQA